MPPGKNGLLCRDGDVADLTAKLARLLTDNALQTEAAREAHLTIREKFSIPVMVDSFVRAVKYSLETRGN